jgi:hypothetical protein
MYLALNQADGERVAVFFATVGRNASKTWRYSCEWSFLRMKSMLVRLL